MEQPDDPAPVTALVSDLIFASRISAEARPAGVKVRIVRNAAALDSSAGNLLLADLNVPGAIEAAAAWAARGGRVVSFVSHADSATIGAANKAGLAQVMARSAFVAMLGDILRRA